MTLFQDTGGDPRAARARLADVLAFYSAIGDAACGLPPGFAARKAAVAVSIARTAHVDETTRDALYFAGLLHAIGAIGNNAYRKGERLSERNGKMERWDVPAQGARMCQSIGALPEGTADFIRWQSECWDGTGYPDQLRWHGIPKPAQCLALAHRFLISSDPEEALSSVALDSGRAFSPEASRVFTMWYHLFSGEPPQVAMPVDALALDGTDPALLLEEIADRIDDHNGVTGRWSRVARLADGTASLLGMNADARERLLLAARLYGAGELIEQNVEDTDFDPLSRLGIEDRSEHARRSAALIAGNATLDSAQETLAHRSEWFDGTGRPRGLRGDAIPLTSRVLGTAVAYDHLDMQHRSHIRGDRSAPAERIDTAAGTQFDPSVVRALLETAKARA